VTKRDEGLETVLEAMRADDDCEMTCTDDGVLTLRIGDKSVVLAEGHDELMTILEGVVGEAREAKREKKKMSTFWLSFFNPDETVYEKRFLGVAIIDMDESEGELPSGAVARRAWKLGINPGGAVKVMDVTGDKRIKDEHKNKLILDEDLLLMLGSSGRAEDRDRKKRH